MPPLIPGYRFSLKGTFEMLAGNLCSATRHRTGRFRYQREHRSTLMAKSDQTRMQYALVQRDRRSTATRLVRFYIQDARVNSSARDLVLESTVK